MKLSTEMLTDLARLDELAPHWEALVTEDRNNLLGLDAINGPGWFTALTTTFPAARATRIVVLRNHGEVVALLPLIAKSGGLGCRRLTPVTSLYGSRSGLLLKYPDPALLGALLQATNKFRTMGELRVAEIADPASANQALEATIAVDRASWKQTAGRAITSKPTQDAFRRAFFGPSSRAGLLCGQALYLGQSPLAHNYGLLKSGVYSSLNVCQTSEYKALSPGHLVNLHLINALHMRKIEPHKLRRSDQTRHYKKHQAWIYSGSACGAMGWGMHAMKRAAKRTLARGSVGLIDGSRAAE